MTATGFRQHVGVHRLMAFVRWKFCMGKFEVSSNWLPQAPKSYMNVSLRRHSMNAWWKQYHPLRNLCPNVAIYTLTIHWQIIEAWFAQILIIPVKYVVWKVSFVAERQRLISRGFKKEVLSLICVTVSLTISSQVYLRLYSANNFKTMKHKDSLRSGLHWCS